MGQIECNLCGSACYKMVYHLKKESDEKLPLYKITEDKNLINDIMIVRCLKCGLMYVNPPEHISDIHSMYREMRDEVYVSEEKGRRLAASIVLKKISRYSSGGKILDIGCATGFFLDEAKRLGWETYGVELSRWALEHARSRFNLNVLGGTLKEAEFPNNYFDSIVMNDTIEHLADPIGTLKEIRRILNLNGILCISTPDIESLLSKLLGAQWWGIQQSHLYYFSRNTLNKMLDASGFKVISYTPHVRIFSFAYWSRRIKNYNTLLGRIAGFFLGGIFFRDKLLKLSFNDQIEVFARAKPCK